MQPIREFKFDNIDKDIVNNFFNIHNRVLKNLKILNSALSDQLCSDYLDVLLSRFKVLSKKKDKIKDSFICCTKPDIDAIKSEAKKASLKQLIEVKSLLHLGFTNKVQNYISKTYEDDNDANIPLGALLEKIFDYSYNRTSLLKFYQSLGFNVCVYCLAQTTTIYKSSTNGNYYLRGELDHIIPKDSNPLLSLAINNLVPVCGPCNRRKSNNSFNYNPFNEKHKHEFDFTQCFDIVKGKVVFGSLKSFKILADKSKHGDLAYKLNYSDLYSNFENTAKILTSRFNNCFSQGYTDSLDKVVGNSNAIEEVKYYVSDTPMSHDSFLKFPLAKFKAELFQEILTKAKLKMK